MRIAATDDVSEATLSALSRDLSSLTEVEVDESRTFYKSAEPPSWVALLEHVPTWAALLGPSAAVFLNELLKESAKDVYRNKAAIARTLATPVVRPLKHVAAVLTRFRSRAGRTQLEVGFPSPDDYFGTRLQLAGQDEESIALELALFVNHSGAIAALMGEPDGRAAKVIGQVTLSVLPDGSMYARWMDSNAEIRQVTLPPPAP